MRHHNGNLKKRCGCPRRQWAKCSHPWHLDFQHNGKSYRFSLHKVAKKPRDHEMSKSEAIEIRDRLCSQIRGGEFIDADAPKAPDIAQTFGDVCDVYLKRHVQIPTRRERSVQQMEAHVRILRRTPVPVAGGVTLPLEMKPAAAVSKADVEALRVHWREEQAAARAERERRRAEDVRLAEAAANAGEAVEAPKRPVLHGKPGAKNGEVENNRRLARLRHIYNWALAEGFVEQTPFKRHGVAVVKLDHRVEAPRERRLRPGEEEPLLKAASPHLRSLVVAALSTGCRLGELLGLQWGQVERDEKAYRRILLLAGKTKTHRARVIPIGPRLRAELEMRELDPDGKRFSPAAYVFGNETGEQIKSIKTAWRLTCQRAGIVDLHFHDLRREFGSRLLESGASAHDVQEFLGHAALSTTSRYLRTSYGRLEAALRRLEGNCEDEGGGKAEDARMEVAQDEGVGQSHTRVAQNPTKGAPRDTAAPVAVVSNSIQ